jgi:hypothetical protein
VSMWDQMSQALLEQIRQQQQQDQATLETARTQPIPGFTGPTNTGQIPGVGMAPTQPPLLPQPLPGTAHPSMNSGPYGQQAMQLAGVRPTMFAPGQMPHGTRYVGDADPRLQQLGLTMDQARHIPMLGAYGQGGLREAFQQRFPNGSGGLLGRMFNQPASAPPQFGLLGGPPKGFRIPGK